MSDHFRQIESFVALFDILGFRELIGRSETIKVAKTYEKMKSDFTKYTDIVSQASHSKIVSRCFSDTFLLYTTEPSDASFRALIIACQFLYLAALSNRLYLRGAVTYGELTVSEEMEIGPAIVEAYEHEQKQDWMGCWVTESCISRVSDLKRYLDEKSIVKYEIPLKSGIIEEKYAFNWIYLFVVLDSYLNDRPSDTKSRIASLARSMSKWDNLNWEGMRKLENTKRFLKLITSPQFVMRYDFERNRRTNL
jgi:hypothetical protein